MTELDHSSTDTLLNDLEDEGSDYCFRDTDNRVSVSFVWRQYCSARWVHDEFWMHIFRPRPAQQLERRCLFVVIPNNGGIALRPAGVFHYNTGDLAAWLLDRLAGAVLVCRVGCASVPASARIDDNLREVFS